MRRNCLIGVVSRITEFSRRGSISGHFRAAKIGGALWSSGTELVAVSLQAADDPFIGSWKINLGKSKTAGASSSRADVFEAFGKNGLKYTSTDVDQNGNTSQVTWAAAPDGKFYPMKGSPRWDATTLQRIDRFTIEMNQSKAGKWGVRFAARSLRTERQ